MSFLYSVGHVVRRIRQITALDVPASSLWLAKSNCQVNRTATHTGTGYPGGLVGFYVEVDGQLKGLHVATRIPELQTRKSSALDQRIRLNNKLTSRSRCSV